MTIWNAVLLGLIHGIAEFLPVSSSGHFSIVNNLFKLSDLSQGHMLFQALLYLASMAAVMIVYWPEICAMYWELISLAGFGPLAGQEKERYPAARLPINSRMGVLNGRNIFIGIMLIMTGCILYISDRMLPGRKNLSSMTIFDALIIGLCQSVATIPGLSRSAVTITAGMAVGLRRDFAVNFSFLLSIPAVFGAAILAFIDTLRDGIDWSCVPAYLVGTAVALVAGVLSIHLMRYIGKKRRFGGFAYYCWVIGVLSIILYLIF